MIIEEHIMKRYTLALVIGVSALVAFITYKTPTMTAPTNTNPPITTLPVKPTIPVKPPIKNMQPLTINVQNESPDDLTVRGVYSSNIAVEGKPATQKAIETRTVAKKSTAPVTFAPKEGYDRLEVEFLKAGKEPVRSVNIIHSANTPASQQTVTIK